MVLFALAPPLLPPANLSPEGKNFNPNAKLLIMSINSHLRDNNQQNKKWPNRVSKPEGHVFALTTVPKIQNGDKFLV